MKHTISNITPGQAFFVLEGLVNEGRVKPATVQKHVARMPSAIAEMEARLAALRGEPVRSTRGRRSASPVRPEVAKSRALQGQYMGLLRHVSTRDKRRAQSLCARMGRERAVEFLRGLQH